MFHTLERIHKDLEFQTNLKSQYNRLLKNLPEGGLATCKVNGKTYYYQVIDGKKRYLGPAQNPVVKKIQKRHFLEKSLKRIEENEKAMRRFLKKYKSIDVEQVIKTSPFAYQPEDRLELSIATQRQQKNWGFQQYRKSTSHPEHLVHRTLKGEFVRSKSEAIIANMLFHNNIPYHYEEVINIGGHNIAPDFRIYVESQQKYKIIEHFGMIGDKDYLEKCVWKIKLYLENGYTPWEDVIFTFDDANGNLDTRMIDNIINAFCK